MWIRNETFRSPKCIVSTIDQQNYSNIETTNKIQKTSKHYTNYGWNNHNVNMCKVKKEKNPTINDRGYHLELESLEK
jgi:hypothetical protein